MSSIATAAQDTSLALVVRSQTFLADLVHAAEARLADEEGQTAAEYMGILLVVSVIIVALAKSDIKTQIVSAVKAQITKIGGGE